MFRGSQMVELMPCCTQDYHQTLQQFCAICVISVRTESSHATRSEGIEELRVSRKPCPPHEGERMGYYRSCDLSFDAAAESHCAPHTSFAEIEL